MRLNKYFTDGHQVDNDFKIIADLLYDKGFENTSWKNDSCTSFMKGDIQVYVDRIDRALRVDESYDRFTVIRGYFIAISTDDLDAVLHEIG